MGFHREVEIERLWHYADFFYAAYLAPHLHRQRQLLDTAGGISPDVVKKVVAAHRSLHRLFSSSQRTHRTLGRAEEKLEAFARFEKMVLSRQPLFSRAPGFSVKDSCELLLDQSLGNALRRWTDRFWELE